MRRLCTYRSLEGLLILVLLLLLYRRSVGGLYRAVGASKTVAHGGLVFAVFVVGSVCSLRTYSLFRMDRRTELTRIIYLFEISFQIGWPG